MAMSSKTRLTPVELYTELERRDGMSSLTTARSKTRQQLTDLDMDFEERGSLARQQDEPRSQRL